MNKFSKYCLALIPGILALGIASEAQAISTSVNGSGFSFPDNDPTGLSSKVSVSDTFVIQDVAITLNNLTHTYAGDLIASLTHVDTGTSVDLFNRPGRIGGSGFGDSSNLGGNYSFSDSFTGDYPAELAALSGSNDILASGNFFPTTADNTQTFLSPFDGESASGTWRLTISDNASSDLGSLGSWTLTLSDTAPSTAVPFEFSPTLGLLLVGAGLGLKKGRDYWHKKKSEVDLI